MMFAGDFVQFADIEQLCKVIKMEHRLVLAVITKECDIFTEIHILEVICDKTAVATLDAFTKFFKNVLFVFHLFYDSAL